MLQHLRIRIHLCPSVNYHSDIKSITTTVFPKYQNTKHMTYSSATYCLIQKLLSQISKFSQDYMSLNFEAVD